MDFNSNYGIWVSAPPGTGSGITSYYGGAYVTTLGSLEPLYKVTEGEDGLPNFTNKILVTAGNTSSPFSSQSVAPVFNNSPGSIIIDKLLPAYFNYTSSPTLILGYTRSDGTYATITYTLNSDNTVSTVNPTGGATLTGVGSLSASSFTGYNKLTLTANAVYSITVNSVTYNDLNFTNSTLNTYLSGVTPGVITFQYVQDITGMICVAVYQTSPRQIPGVLTVSKIDTSPTVTVNGQTVANPNYNTISMSYSELAYSTLTYTKTYAPMSASVTGVDSFNQPNFIETMLAGDLFINAKMYQDFTTIVPTLIPGTLTGITYTTAVSGATTTYTLSGTVTNSVSGSILVNGNPIYFANGQTATQVATVLGALPTQGNDSFSYVSGGVFNTTANPMSSSLVGIRGVLNSTWVDGTNLLPTLTTGYNYVTNPEYSGVQLFFDPHRLSGVATIYASLRAGAFPFTTFISAILTADPIPSNATALQTAVTNIITARATYPNVTGLAYYCNDFYMQESVNGSYYWGFPIGAVANMLALIMENKLGGVAPMFTNEGEPSLGGQLSKSVKRAKFNFTADQNDLLDGAGINPLILDSFYGLMLTSHRTAQSPATLNDWSFLGHSMAFDLFRAEMKQAVMIPQIGKAIDNAHMAIRQKDGQAIMNKRLTGPTAIWDSGKVDATTPNTPATKATNTFMISARVKVNEFSEYVELILDDIAQSDTV